VLRSICQSFLRVAELLALIVESSINELSHTKTQEQGFLKLMPLKNGLAISQQRLQEVGGGGRGVTIIMLFQRPKAIVRQCNHRAHDH
jgi:hypothetical protein